MFRFLPWLQRNLGLHVDRRDFHDYLILNSFAILIGLGGAGVALLFRIFIHGFEILFGGASVNDLMQKGRSIAVQPIVIAELIKKALEARRPKAHYRRGPGSRMAVTGNRMPAWLTDWVFANVLQKRLPTKLIGW